MVEPLQTGKWVKEGKGKNQTTTFLPTSDFVHGDAVVIQATFKDEGAEPVPGATMTIESADPNRSN